MKQDDPYKNPTSYPVQIKLLSLSSFLGNIFLAVFPHLFTKAPSTQAPTNPPARGANFIKLITPFSPALVINLKPTFLLISINTLPGTWLIRDLVTFVPKLIINTNIFHYFRR